MSNLWTTTITLPALLAYGAGGLTALTIASLLIYITLPHPETQTNPALEDLRARLALGWMPMPLMILLIFLYAALAGTILIGLAGILIEILIHAAPVGREAAWDWRFKLAQLAALSGVLGGLIALPLTAVRLHLTSRQTRQGEKQTRQGEERLFNERLEGTLTGLSARIDRADGKHDDDMMQRMFAIERLEMLGRERPDAIPRIARILAVYIKEVSNQHRPVQPPSEEDVQKWREWYDDLRLKRTDIDRAMHVLGALRGVNNNVRTGYEIDLRGVNFQETDLPNTDYSKVFLVRAYFSGAVIFDATFANSNLKNADFSFARLFGVRFKGADLKGCVFHFACLRRIDFTHTVISQDQINSAFGDASVILPKGLTRPAHWPEKELSVEKQIAAYNEWLDDLTTWPQ